MTPKEETKVRINSNFLLCFPNQTSKRSLVEAGCCFINIFMDFKKIIQEVLSEKKSSRKRIKKRKTSKFSSKPPLGYWGPWGYWGGYYGPGGGEDGSGGGDSGGGES